MNIIGKKNSGKVVVLPVDDIYIIAKDHLYIPGKMTVGWKFTCGGKRYGDFITINKGSELQEAFKLITEEMFNSLDSLLDEAGQMPEDEYD